MSMVEESRPVFCKACSKYASAEEVAARVPSRRRAWTLHFRRNDFIPAFDAVAFALMLMEARAEDYPEIGSGGFRTKLVRIRNTVSRYGHKNCVGRSPFPRAEIDTLCDAIIRKALENAVDDVLGVFSERPLVFFDGSSRVLPSSDVVVFFLENPTGYPQRMYLRYSRY